MMHGNVNAQKGDAPQAGNTSSAPAVSPDRGERLSSLRDRLVSLRDAMSEEESPRRLAKLRIKASRVSKAIKRLKRQGAED